METKTETSEQAESNPENIRKSALGLLKLTSDTVLKLDVFSSQVKNNVSNYNNVYPNELRKSFETSLHLLRNMNDEMSAHFPNTQENIDRYGKENIQPIPEVTIHTLIDRYQTASYRLLTAIGGVD
jgi:hypothetical protein